MSGSGVFESKAGKGAAACMAGDDLAGGGVTGW